MVLITNKQQDLIDEIIANHLKNYDKIAQQYLKIRQDMFELTTSITHEITKEKLVSDSNKFKIQQLQYDFDKVCEIYKIHLENINLNLDIKQNIPPMYIEELNLQYDALFARKTDLESEIDTLKNIQKPLLDKMRLLLKSFQNGLNSRTAKRMNRIVSEGINEPDENSKDVDIQSLIFHSSDMEALFNDVDNKLNQLKNLSDGNTNNEDDPNSVIDTNQPKNITRYIDEHLRNGRTFHLLEEDKYIYDVSKSATVDTATSLTSVHEYDKMIENLIINIKDVIEHGAESKERWSNNARKLDIIKETLSKFEDSMDISDDEMES